MKRFIPYFESAYYENGSVINKASFPIIKNDISIEFITKRITEIFM